MKNEFNEIMGSFQKKNEKKGNPHQDLFWRKLDEAGMRDGNYKLIRLKDYGSVMYNLSDDIGEMNDLKTKDSTTFKHMSNKLSNWELELMDPLWGEDESWMDVTYHIHKKLMENKPVYFIILSNGIPVK